MGKYIIKNKKALEKIVEIKEGIKQDVIDGVADEEILNKYFPNIIKDLKKYKENYLIKTFRALHSNYEYIETTTVLDYLLKIEIQRQGKTVLPETVLFDEAKNVCQLIRKRMEEVGFLSREGLYNKARKNRDILKEFVERNLFEELIEIGLSPEMTNIFKEINDFNELVTARNIEYLFSLDLIKIIDLEKAYGEELDTPLDVVNSKLEESEVEESEYERYVDYRNFILEAGGKTKYEIIYDEAQNNKVTLADRLLENYLDNIYTFTKKLDEDKVLKIYYLLITLSQSLEAKTLEKFIKKIDKVLFEGILNIKFMDHGNFLDYFFTDKFRPFKGNEMISLFGGREDYYGLNYGDFNEKYLPRLGSLFRHDFEFLLSETKKVSEEVISFLITFEDLKPLILKWLKKKEFYEVLESFHKVNELKEYFKNRYFYSSEIDNNFIIRKDILGRNIYTDYFSKRFSGINKGWFLEAFEDLSIENKLEFLSQRDYCGRNVLHYAFLGSHQENAE